DGFLRAVGLDSAERLAVVPTDQGEYYFAEVERRGRPTAEVLPELVPALIQALAWPRSMRWGTTAFRWVRPLHAVLCVFDGKPVPGSVDLGSAVPGVAPRRLAFATATRGHRWHAPDAFAVASFTDYRARLEAARVVLDAETRRHRIVEQAQALADQAGLAFVADDALLDEVCGLVEWPVCLIGAIDPTFMDVPPEVLITSMKSHQKYFPLTDAGGGLANRFVMVANIEGADGGAAIRAGNERVLRARLHDAKFFWDQDRKRTLDSRVPALDGIVFHARLGSLGDKVRRLERLGPTVAGYVPGAQPELVARAARLCKADLVTDMVAEFPELQGVMGRYYARHDGEPEAVADAIADHYAPAGPADRCPSAPVSVALALADKIDTLVRFFTIEERPTGSKDPYALRRAALAVIRLVLENGVRIELVPVLTAAKDLEEPGDSAKGTRGRLTATRRVAGWSKPVDTVVLDLLAFFADRLRVHMRERGLRHDVVSAVFAVAGDDDLVRLVARAEALRRFLDTEDGADLVLAYRRASNIVGIEEKRDQRDYAGAPDESALAQDEERLLHQRLAKAGPEIARALKDEKFEVAMAALATLRTPIDAFFDRVTVNTEDARLRENRLRLLSQIRASLA
ncbi:MAG TPA: glycine--tRNA ligase subunit beta, partial [Alphaproteobacteria bacterium]